MRVHIKQVKQQGVYSSLLIEELCPTYVACYNKINIIHFHIALCLIVKNEGIKTEISSI